MKSAIAHDWLTAALDLLFPAFCPICSTPLGAGRRDPLCATCWRGIDRITPPWCHVCGLPFPTFGPPVGASTDEADEHGATVRVDRCQACTLDTPPFAWARAAGVYGGPLREAIHAFKFTGKRALARPLGALVREQLAAHLPGDVDALVPVPLAPARERERGFNQARLVAERLGTALGVPVEVRWLTRARATQPQADLSAMERRKNVRGAFVAAPAVMGRHVAVVDDVLTTGATVAECARALRAAGARKVGVLTVARVV